MRKKLIDAMLWIIIIHWSIKEDEDIETILGTTNKNIFQGGM